MKNKIKLVVLFIGIVMVLCGCDIEIKKLDEYFNNSISSSIQQDSLGLEDMAKAVKFDAEYSQIYSEFKARNDQLKNDLLAIVANDSDPIELPNTSGQKLSDVLEIDYINISAGLTMLALHDCIADTYKKHDIINDCRRVMSTAMAHRDLNADKLEDIIFPTDGGSNLANEPVWGSESKITFSTTAINRSLQIVAVDYFRMNLFSTNDSARFNPIVRGGAESDVTESEFYSKGGTWDYYAALGLYYNTAGANEIWHIDTNDDIHKNVSGKAAVCNGYQDDINEKIARMDSFITAIDSLSDYGLGKQTFSVDGSNYKIYYGQGIVATVTAPSNYKKYRKLTSSTGNEFTVTIKHNDALICTTTIKFKVSSGINNQACSTGAQTVDTFQGKINDLKNMLNTIQTGKIYSIKENASLSYVFSAMRGSSVDTMLNCFEDSGYKRRNIIDDGKDKIDKDSLFADIDIPLKIDGGIYVGRIRKKTIVTSYTSGLACCGDLDRRPVFMYARSGSEPILFLLKYPVSRVEKINFLGDGNNYNFSCADSKMWVKLDENGNMALYNDIADETAFTSSTQNIYLYDKESVALMYNTESLTDYEIKLNKSKLNSSDGVYKVSGDGEIISRFVLMDYLEGLYLPGLYPNDGTDVYTGSISDGQAENVIALGRRIHLDSNVFAGDISYDTVVGKIYSAVTSSHGTASVSNAGEVKVNSLISVCRGNEKVQRNFEHPTFSPAASTVSFVVNVPGASIVQRNSKIDKVSTTAGTTFIGIDDANNNNGYYFLATYTDDHYSDSSNPNITHKTWIYPFNIAQTGSQVNGIRATLAFGNGYNIQGTPMDKNRNNLDTSHTVYALDHIKAGDFTVTCTDQDHFDCNLTTTMGGTVMLEVKPKGVLTSNTTVTVTLKVTSGEAKNRLLSIKLTLKWDTETSSQSNVSSTMSSEGGPIVLASSSTVAGTIGTPFHEGGANRVYNNSIKVAKLMHYGDSGSSSHIMAHKETLDAKANRLPQLFIMGTSFDAKDTSFDKWINEDQEPDPDHDGNLRKWIAILEDYGYKNYPCNNIENIEAVVDAIQEIVERVYNFGSLEDEDSAIMLDPDVIALVQAEINRGIIKNEAQFIRAMAKIIGAIISFIGFLWLVAWLIDAGTTGDGDGALYKVTFKHMKTGTGMTRKEAIELSTGGYKYVTLSMLLWRSFILMALGVTLLIADPINIVSVIIGWVDGAYRLIKENIFNVRQ